MGAGTRVEFTLVEGDAMKAIVAGYRLEVFLFFFFSNISKRLMPPSFIFPSSVVMEHVAVDLYL